jgi:hypothetical protein
VIGLSSATPGVSVPVGRHSPTYAAHDQAAFDEFAGAAS